MSRRAFAVILAMTTLMMCFSPAAYAADVSGVSSISNLSSLGMKPVHASFAPSSRKTDGILSAGEYPVLLNLSFGVGLFLATAAKGVDVTGKANDLFSSIDFSGVSVTFGITYDVDSIYTVFQVRSNCDGLFSPSTWDGSGNANAVTLSVGINQSELLLPFSSAFTCTYYFRNQICSAAEGYVSLKDEDGCGVFPCRFGEIVKTKQNTFTDGQGRVWNSALHRKNAAYSFSNDNGVSVFTAECAVPVGEVLLSAPQDQRDELYRQLLDKRYSERGCFKLDFLLPATYDSSDAAMADQVVLTTGIGTDGSSDATLPPILPAPLTFLGKGMDVNVGVSASTETRVSSSRETLNEAIIPDLNSTSPNDFSAPVLSDGNAAAQAETETEELAFPETLLFPETTDEVREYESQESSAPSPYLGIISGVLLSLTALFLLIAISREERRARLHLESEAAKVEKHRLDREKQKAEERRNPARVRKRKR